MVHAVVRSMVLWIRGLECDIGMIKTQQKYDKKKLDCYQRSMTPRLRAESTGERMTSLGK